MRRDHRLSASGIAHEMAQFLRFAAVGLVATAIHFVVALTAYRLAGLGVWSANLSGFFMALSFSYLGHYYFSFASVRAHRSAVWRFFATALIAYLANLFVLWLVASTLDAAEEIALVLGIAVMPIVTFTLSRLWVY